MKDGDTLPNQVAGVRWTRLVLDDFTSPGTGHALGVIHQVVCADIDGDGVDEFLVAMMAPSLLPGKGQVYGAINVCPFISIFALPIH